MLNVCLKCLILFFRTGYQGDNFVRYSGDAQNFAKKQSKIYLSLKFIGFNILGSAQNLIYGINFIRGPGGIAFYEKWGRGII